MGSIRKARIPGFVCRLCTALSRVVIHIFGNRGKKLNLVEKVNKYVPIKISPTDSLPKAICLKCLNRVEKNYALMRRLAHINWLVEISHRRNISEPASVSNTDFLM